MGRKQILMLFFLFNCIFSISQNQFLRIGIRSFPSFFHPVYSTDEISQMILNKIYNSLFDFGPSGQIRKSLIKKYSLISEKEIKIQIKEEVYFSNGSELNINDVQETVKLLKDPSNKYPYQENLRFIKKISKISKYEMMLYLHYPYALWKNHLTFKILSKKEIQSIELNELRQKQLSGSNAYTYERITEPISIQLVQNKFYNKQLRYKRLKFIVFNYSHLAPLKLINDELDVVEIAGKDARIYYSKPGWQKEFRLEEFSKIGYYFLVFNLRRSEITLNLRKKFYNLITCSNFVNEFLNGSGRTFNSPFYFLNDKIKVKKRICSDFKTKTITIMTNSESVIRKNFLLFLSQELKKDGINLKCEFFEYHTFIKKLKDKNYQMAVTGFMLESDLDMKDVFHSKSLFNYAGFRNKEMDQLMEKGLLVVDYKKREPIYLRAHQVWYKNLPLIPLFQIYYYMGISNKIKPQSNFYKIVASESDFLNNIQQWE